MPIRSEGTGVNEAMRSRGKPKRICMEAINRDIIIINITEMLSLVVLNGRREFI